MPASSRAKEAKSSAAICSWKPEWSVSKAAEAATYDVTGRKARWTAHRPHQRRRPGPHPAGHRGVAAMKLHHVPGKAELVDLMLDAAYRRLTRPATDPGR